MTILSILRSGFLYFFGDGVGCSGNWGGRGVSSLGEINPSAAGSVTGFGEVGGLLCFYTLTSNACGGIRVVHFKK